MIRIAALLLASLAGSTLAEPLSVTFIDEVGDPLTYNGAEAGDVREGRIFFGAQFKTLDFEFETTTENPFNNNGQFMTMGGDIINLDSQVFPFWDGATAKVDMPAPRQTLSLIGVFGVPAVNAWQPGERVVINRGYGFDALDLALPDQMTCLNCNWLFGVYAAVAEGFGDEFESAFASFGIVSRHPWETFFGSLTRDESGELLNGIRYFTNKTFGSAVATVSGPLAAALENRPRRRAGRARRQPRQPGGGNSGG